MTDPITPPPQLMCEWINKSLGSNLSLNATIGMISYNEVATQAANWGADQELEACCNWLLEACCDWLIDNQPKWAAALRAARRPKPKNLVEEALEAMQRMWEGSPDADDWSLIRRALGRLQELEGKE